MNLRHLFSAFLILPSAFAGTPVLYSSGHFAGGVALTNPVTLQPWPAANTIIISGTNFTTGLPITLYPNTNGIATTNLLPNTYRMQISGISVGVLLAIPDTTNTVNLSSCVTSGAGYFLFTNNVIGAVKVKAADTQPGFISDKLTLGTGLTYSYTTNIAGGISMTLAWDGTLPGDFLTANSNAIQNLITNFVPWLNSTGTVRSPVNFWLANSNAINAVIGPFTATDTNAIARAGGYGTNTHLISPVINSSLAFSNQADAYFPQVLAMDSGSGWSNIFEFGLPPTAGDRMQEKINADLTLNGELTLPLESASRVAVINSSGVLKSDANVSLAELGYLDGVTSSLQTQLAQKVGTNRSVSAQYSITGGGALTADRTLTLVGDTLSPGPSKLYGTDSGGNRGWVSGVGVAADRMPSESYPTRILTRTPAKLATAQTPIKMLSMGNSVSTGQSFQWHLMSLLEQKIGRSGTAVFPANNSNFDLWQVYAGNTYLQPSSTNWYGPFWQLTNGGYLRFTNFNLPTPQAYQGMPYQRFFKLWYFKQPSGGTCAISVSLNNGAFTNIVTLDTSSAGPVTLAFTNIDTQIYLGAYGSIQGMVTNMTGTNWVLGAEQSAGNDGAAEVGGVVNQEIAYPGIQFATMQTVASQVWDTVLTNLAPDLIVFNAKFQTFALSNLVWSHDMLRSKCPNADIVWVLPPWGTNASYADEAEMNRMIWTNAQAWGDAVVDLRGLTPSLDYMITNSLIDAEGIHPTPAFYAAAAAKAFHDLGLSGALASARPGAPLKVYQPQSGSPMATFKQRSALGNGFGELWGIGGYLALYGGSADMTLLNGGQPELYSANLMIGTSASILNVPLSATAGPTLARGGYSLLTFDADKHPVFQYGIATNWSAGTDGMVLTKTGDKLKVVAAGITPTNTPPANSLAQFTGNGNEVRAAANPDVDFGNITATNVDGTFYRSVWIPAGAMLPPTNNAATWATNSTAQNDAQADAWTFADAATNYVRIAWSPPDTWNLGTLKAQIYATCTGTNSAAANLTNSVWSIAAGAAGSGDALNASLYGTAVWVTNNHATGSNVLVRATTAAITAGGTPSKGDVLWLNLARLGGQAGDTITNTAINLLGVRIQYAVTNLSDTAW